MCVCDRENKDQAFLLIHFYFPVHSFDPAKQLLTPQFQNLMTSEKLHTNNNVELYQEKKYVFSKAAVLGLANTEKQRLATVVASMICRLNIVLSCYPHYEMRMSSSEFCL